MQNVRFSHAIHVNYININEVLDKRLNAGLGKAGTSCRKK